MSALRPIALVATALAIGCGPTRRSEPLSGRFIPDSPAVSRGEVVFAKYCQECHPNGAAGVGIALNDKPLPELAIKTQVRQGLGTMPAFGEETISDADLDALAAFVVEYRQRPR